MTTAAMALGVVPLIIAEGAGAAARYSMGLVIFTGVLVGTLFTLFVVRCSTPSSRARSWRRRWRARGPVQNRRPPRALKQAAAPRDFGGGGVKISAISAPQREAEKTSHVPAPLLARCRRPAVIVPFVGPEAQQRASGRAFARASAPTRAASARRLR